MGISFSQQSSTQTQSINNKVLNASNAQCNASCNDFSGGNTIIISGSTINSDVVFNQSCNVTMQCTINSQLDTNIQDILNSMQKQTSVTANGFPSFSLDSVSNSTTATQNITTTVSNLINSSCQSTSNIVSQNNFTYLQNSTINGSLQFSQTGNVNNTCTLNNISSIQLANQATAQSTQTAAILNPVALLFVAFLVIGLLIGAVFLLNFLFKGGKGGGTQKIEVVPGAVGGTGAAEAGGLEAAAIAA
jgi:hypothetical protein